MDRLIFKYLEGELTTDEQSELQRWLDENPENQLTLTKLESYYGNAENGIIETREEVWDELKSNIQLEESATFKTRKIHPETLLYRIAAIVVIAVSLTFILYSSFDSESPVPEVAQVEKQTHSGEKLTTKLPDGTTVILNANSMISFPEQFNMERRVVELSGEAFFEVRHDAGRPFFVKFKGLEVEVLGTSFNIRNYQEENEISVAVATGKVSFRASEPQSEVILEPTEMVSYDQVKKKTVKQKFDPVELYGWKDKILYFKNAEFKHIVKDLERWYGVKIIVKKDFSSKGTFSGEFKNKSLETVLIGLSYLYEFKYKIEQNTVTLK